MLRTHLILPLAFASVAFLWGCQEQALSPTGPNAEAVAPNLDHKGRPHGKPHGGGDPTEPVTWSSAEARVHGAIVWLDNNHNILQSNSTCTGVPGSKTSNPSVWWNDEPDGETPGSTNGCAQVTAIDGAVSTLLTNDANVLVGMKKGSTKYTIQFQIQDVGGPEGIQYRTDKFVVDAKTPFTGAGYILHVDTTVEIWKLKGHTGGPKVESAGFITIGDIVYK